MTRDINYDSKILEEWVVNAIAKEQLVCAMPLAKKEKFYNNSGKIRIEPLPQYEFYKDGDIGVGSVKLELKVNGILAQVFCGIDCNYIDNIILTNNQLSSSILHILKTPMGHFIEDFCCGVDNIECRDYVSQKISGLVIEIDSDYIN